VASASEPGEVGAYGHVKSPKELGEPHLTPTLSSPDGEEREKQRLLFTLRKRDWTAVKLIRV